MILISEGIETLYIGIETLDISLKAEPRQDEDHSRGLANPCPAIYRKIINFSVVY